MFYAALMADNIYKSDPRAKSVEGFIAGLTILSRYMAKGLAETYFMGGEHDVIHIYVDIEDCPDDSEDGQKLSALGFHCGDDGWEYWT